MNIADVSDHAVTRFQERAGVASRSRAAKQLRKLARQARPQPDGRYIANGWTLVINCHGWVETVFRKGNMQNKAGLKKRIFRQN